MCALRLQSKKDPKFYQNFSTPLGMMEVHADQAFLYQMNLCRPGGKAPVDVPNVVTKRAVQQVQEYFHGDRQNFDLSLCLQGTTFQKKVWNALSKIPFGESRSYGEIAKIIGHPKAYRAVGMANHRNPFMIIIPCHRVIGANKKLVGYAPGLQYQEWLLDFEERARARSIAGGCE